MKKITELTYVEVKSHFLQQESYVNFGLPEYFSFEPLLKKMSEKMSSEYLESKILNKAKKSYSINHSLMSNKDGKYSWRKFEIIHPALYISLVNLISKEENWNLIKESLEHKVANIDCLSIPVISQGEMSNKAEQVSNWYDRVERKSVQLGLDYRKLYQTDITDCYGSFYTHSISWALHTKEMARTRRDRKDSNGNRLLGSHIDEHLQAMSFGQTNGIPQGSDLMDLIAELLLCFSDIELNKKIESAGIIADSYTIIRFRDDYRIFTNSEKVGESILLYINETMSDLGLRLSPAKTSISANVARDSLKLDKVHSIKYPKKVPSKINFHSVREELFYIESFGEMFPNSGITLKRLKKLHKNIKSSSYAFTLTDSLELSSILVQIASHNPRVFSQISANLSCIINDLPLAEKISILAKILLKFNDYPNAGDLYLWLQRISIKFKRDLVFEEKLCNIAALKEDVELFNNEWLDEVFVQIINDTSIIDEAVVSSLDTEISPYEIDLFYQES